MKKLLARLLSLILCVALAVGVAAFPALADGEVDPSADPTDTTESVGPGVGAPGSCNGVHTWDGGHWDADKASCDIGRGQVFYKTCTVCGAEMHIAFRPPEDNEDHVFTLTTDGSTKHQFEEHEYPSECEYHPTVEKVCTVCHHTVVEIGTHNWVAEGEVIKAEMCTSNDLQQYRCADCGATKIEEIPNSKGSHVFETRESEPTCTDYGYQYRECTKCGYIYYKTVTANPLGHQWESGDGTDHTQDQHCTRCGEIRKATEHTWSGWKYDDDFHWKECTDCKTKKDFAEHKYVNGVCECGKTKPVCDHNWVISKRFGVFDHIEVCTVCGEEKTVSCGAGSRLVPRTYCTDPTYCECGNIVAEGQKRHNFGTWICHDETHEHRCLNRDCQYVEGGTHTYTTKGNVTLCSVCKMVNASAAPVHQHTFPDTWTAGTNGCYKLCTDPTCSAMQAASHVLGPADCAGHATCLNCGAVVTTTPSGVHTGGTEIRGAYPAEVGKAGYTGDTYCLVCGRVVAWGSFIEPLLPEHVHNFNVIGHDAYNHWTECSCGERQNMTAHTGGSATCCTLAKCTGCGAEYGDFDHTAHVGGTEVRGAKDPAPGVEGYTGDTYCIACGLMIDQGDVIEALPVPEDPTTPTAPSESDTPTTPTEPDVPEDPTEPATPSESDAPTTPTEPVTPDVPETPTEPDVPEEPTRPTSPSTPDIPVIPDIPGVTEEPLKPVSPQSFSDLPENGYEREAVEFAVNHGLMFGVDEENVSPYTFATRGQVMTILARAVGINTGSGADWDKKGIAWAVENGLTTNDASNPVMTREELMYMLWVMANCPSVDPSVLSGFSDAADVSDVYLTAMAWAVQNGIMDGEIDGSATDLAPGEGVQRVMLAAFIERAIEKGLIG